MLGTGADQDWEFDWAGNARAPKVSAVNDRREKSMDVDGSESSPEHRDGQWKKLDLVREDGESLGLGDLDISFDATKSSDGRLRVRVHSSAKSHEQMAIEPQTVSLGHELSFAPPSLYIPDSDPLGPFLGMSSPNSLVSANGEYHFDAASFFGNGALAASPTEGHTASQGSTRRVRIALRSPPAPGGEGGEWEVEVR